MKTHPAWNWERPAAGPRIATRTAIPTTPPICRAMLKRALPVAERPGGSPATAAPARMGNTKLTPIPVAIIPGSMSAA